MIETEHLTKAFGEKVVVNDLSLSVAQGEFFVFLGPNGAGKTTTIKMLAGLLLPTRGKIRICGCDTQRDGMHARAFLSYIPDQPYLYDKLTGREFLDFVAHVYGMDRGRRASAIEQLIEIFEMKEYIDELCQTYSHGMKQRVVIASALVHEPRVIVIDEPMVGLDPKSTRLTKDILRDRARRGATLFMSTHTISLAEEVADRIGIIQRGTMIAYGTPAEIRRAGHTDARLEDAFLRLTAEEDETQKGESGSRNR
jgi:ABC-2 type transport system ATP-binding protein